MSSVIQIGLVKIPFMNINFVNSRYSEGGLHQFSSCCGESVGNKKYCKGCNKDLVNSEIKKGLDKDTILTEQQEDNLKEYLENGIMEVLSIQEITETTTYDIIPYIQKTQIMLPNISKGYKKVDYKTFCSFKLALKELNKFCVVKLTQRGTEHLGILISYKDDLVFIEVCFNHYINKEQVDSLRDTTERQIELEKISNPIEYKEQAITFLENFKSKVKTIDEVKEDKKILLSKYFKEIENGFQTETEIPPIQIKERNPFI
jgi:hypothetical protein